MELHPKTLYRLKMSRAYLLPMPLLRQRTLYKSRVIMLRAQFTVPTPLFILDSGDVETGDAARGGAYVLPFGCEIGGDCTPSKQKQICIAPQKSGPPNALRLSA